MFYGITSVLMIYHSSHKICKGDILSKVIKEEKEGTINDFPDKIT